MRTLSLLLWSLAMLSVAHAQPARPLAITLCVEGDPALEAPAADRLERRLGGARLRVVAQAACPAGGHVGRFEQAGGRVVFRLRAPGGISVHRAVVGLTSGVQPLAQLQAAGRLSPFGVQLYGLLLEARAERAAQAAAARRRRARRATPQRRRRPARPARAARSAPPTPAPPVVRRPPPPPEPSVLAPRPRPRPAPVLARTPSPAPPVPRPASAPVEWRADAWVGARARPTGWAPTLGGAFALGAWRLTVDGDLPTDGRWRGLPLRWAALAAEIGWAPQWAVGRWRLGPALGLGAEALWARRLDATDPGGQGWQPVASVGALVAWAQGAWRVGVHAQGRGAWPAEEARVPGGPRAALAPWGLALGLGLGWAP